MILYIRTCFGLQLIKGRTNGRADKTVDNTCFRQAAVGMEIPVLEFAHFVKRLLSCEGMFCFT